MATRSTPRSPGWEPLAVAAIARSRPISAPTGRTASASSRATTSPSCTPVAIGPERLRARVTNAPGVIAFGFDGQALTIPHGETTVGKIDEHYGTLAPPYDIGMRNDSFAVRFVGQLLADAEADVALTVD